MLIVSEEAATAIRDLCDSSGAPDGAGLRIYARPVGENEATLELELAPDAAPGDQVMEEGGATIYLEPHAAVYLNDKILDAQSDDDQVRFMINQQGQGAG